MLKKKELRDGKIIPLGRKDQHGFTKNIWRPNGREQNVHTIGRICSG
jgi:hypothetical protein